MPRKAKKQCSYPGCPELVERGTQYCERHQAKAYSDYDNYVRTDEEKARYRGSWERIRAAYLLKHPYCEVCFSQGVMKSAQMVHHVKPLSQGGSHAESNLQAICYACHGKQHPEKGQNRSKSAKPH